MQLVDVDGLEAGQLKTQTKAAAAGEWDCCTDQVTG